MNLTDFKNVIGKYMKEEDMIYLIVGDKATQLKEVSQLKGKVLLLDNQGTLISEGSN
jgi:zinc protease